MMRDARYWDEFGGMCAASLLGAGFLFYGLSAPGKLDKAIGGLGGLTNGVVAIALSHRVRLKEFYVQSVEEADRTIFIEGLASEVEAAIAPELPEPEPEPVINPPALPVAGVASDTPEQQFKRCECPKKDDPQLRQLWDYLSFNHPEVLMLLEVQCLLLYGEQGSGKTTFASFLALLRHLFLDHKLYVCDPHAHQNRQKWLGGVCEVYGFQYDYEAIGQQIDAYYGRLKQEHISQPVTSIWDEVTNYAERVPGGDRDFLKSALSDARKGEEYIILMSHDDTLGALGGSKGTSRMKERGLTKVLLLGSPDPLGKVKPVGRGTIFGLFKNEEGKPLKTPIVVPEFMNPGYLASLFLQLKETSDTQKRILNNLAKLPEPEPEDSEPEPLAEPPMERLEPPLNQTFDSEPVIDPIPGNWQFFDVRDFGTGSQTSLVRAVIVSCIRAGWSQNRTIEAVFGIKRGGSEIYSIARDIYQSIKDIVEER